MYYYRDCPPDYKLNKELKEMLIDWFNSIQKTADRLKDESYVDRNLKETIKNKCTRCVDFLNNRTYSDEREGHINTEANNDIFISTLNSIKYDELIGGPLKACIESQAVAAMRSWRFLQECGLGGDVQKYYDLLTFTKPFIETNNSPGIFDSLSQLNEELSDAITELNRIQQ